jgi:hypothetical protein
MPVVNLGDTTTVTVKPASQSYLSCDPQGNCCDLETNICQNISYDPGMSQIGQPTPISNVGSMLSKLGDQIGNWVSKNPVIAVGGFVALFIVSGSSRYRRY